MSLAAFTIICNILQTNYGLKPTLNVSFEESMAIFNEYVGTMKLKDMLV